MTRPEQDEDERSFIIEMVQRLGLELERDPVQLKPPNPDAELLLRGGQRVGLEIIEAHAERLKAAWSSTSRVVERRITEELRAKSVQAQIVGGLPISGYVTATDAMAECFISPFDKTLFLDRGSRCVCLKTEAPDQIHG